LRIGISVLLNLSEYSPSGTMEPDERRWKKGASGLRDQVGIRIALDTEMLE